MTGGKKKREKLLCNTVMNVYTINQEHLNSRSVH